MTKLKMWQNSNCDQTQKLKLWQKSKDSNCDKTQKLKLWQNLNYDKYQVMNKKNLKGSFSKNFLTPWQSIRYSLGSILHFLPCFVKHHLPVVSLPILPKYYPMFIANNLTQADADCDIFSSTISGKINFFFLSAQRFSAPIQWKESELTKSFQVFLNNSQALLFWWILWILTNLEFVDYKCSVGYVVHKYRVSSTLV